MDSLFPVELATPEAPARFRVAVDVPVPVDGPLLVPCLALDVIAFASLSCPDLLGAATAELVQVWADIGEEKVPSMSAMAWAVARRACGAAAMRAARMTVEPAG
jgi:hypothetical protein